MTEKRDQASNISIVPDTDGITTGMELVFSTSVTWYIDSFTETIVTFKLKPTYGNFSMSVFIPDRPDWNMGHQQ